MSRSVMSLQRPRKRWWRPAPQPLNDRDVAEPLRPMLGDRVTGLLSGPSGEVNWEGSAIFAQVSVARDPAGAISEVSVSTWGGADDTLADQQDVHTIVDAFLALADRCGWPLESNYGPVTPGRRAEILELF